MTTTTQRHAASTVDPAPLRQYNLARILGIWAAAALPMGALVWLVAPRLAVTLHGPTALSRALILMLLAGLIWQFLLVVIVVYRELRTDGKTLRWSSVKDALWLHAPRSPKTGRRGGWLWLITVPLIAALAFEELLPTLPTPPTRDMGLFLGSEPGQAFLAGNGVWLGIIVLLQIFNTVLGEELLFRGLLLPRMNGQFGRWDWVANGVLFALYHLHVPWVIPQALLDTFILAFPSKRYRSALVGIVVHSAQSVFFIVLTSTVVFS